MSFPSSAVSDVNCEPVSCMPSPESPAKRTITWESCSTGLAIALTGIAEGLEISPPEKHSIADRQEQCVARGVADEYAVVARLRLLARVGDARDDAVAFLHVGKD